MPGLAFACDFDGTIAPHDVGAEFARHFSPGRERERAELLEAWQSESIGGRELTEAQCRLVRATAAQARAFARRFAIDSTFAPFVGEAESFGEPVIVVSDGFDFYIRALLGEAGLDRLPHTANHLRFAEEERVVPEFPHSGGCGRCGNCKAPHVLALAAGGRRTVFVGDGYSDRCAARIADHVVARGSLAEWCEQAGIAFAPFTEFADVARIARALRDGDAPERRAAPRLAS